MEGARSPSPPPGDELELTVLGRQLEERTPLNGALRVLPSSAGDPRPAQAHEENPWSSCSKTVVGRCKLWMVIACIFLGLLLVIVIGLCLTGETLFDGDLDVETTIIPILIHVKLLFILMYIDEDENEIIELSSNKTFFIMLKIPEQCLIEEELPHLLTKRLTDVYSTSPSLSRYFMSVEVVDFSGGNSTVTYHLQFGVPLEDEGFMKHMMSEELVLGVLLQDFHDQSVPGCEGLGLHPESLLLYE